MVCPTKICSSFVSTFPHEAASLSVKPEPPPSRGSATVITTAYRWHLCLSVFVSSRRTQRHQEKDVGSSSNCQSGCIIRDNLNLYLAMHCFCNTLKHSEALSAVVSIFKTTNNGLFRPCPVAIFFEDWYYWSLASNSASITSSLPFLRTSPSSGGAC